MTGLTSGNLTFANGDESKTFVVTANEDTEAAHEIDDVELDFGTLPSGVTSSRSSQTYRAVVRILDDDFSKTVSAREDQPSDWRFGALAAPEDPEMQTLKWWIDGPEAQYFELGTPIIEPPGSSRGSTYGPTRCSIVT